MNTKQDRQFIRLLRQALCGDVGELRIEDWQRIWKLAAKNRLESLIYSVARNRFDLPQEVKDRLAAAWQRDVIRDTRQEYMITRIDAVFRESGISFAPMKGVILKHNYPESYLRFMTDIDFYIQTSDRSRIERCMEILGATSTSHDCGDIAYNLPGGVHAEFHGRLLYKSTGTGVVGYSDWTWVDEEKNCLTEEGYALNLIGHMAYNLATSGLGVRYVLDLWVYRHRHTPQPNWDEVMVQLKKDGLDRVAQNLIDLSECWLGIGEYTPVLEELEEYIFGGGLYGLSSRNALSGAGLNGSKFGAVWRQVFRSREEFENRYPWLKRYPILLPVAWGKRAVYTLTRNRKIVERWSTSLKEVSSSEIKEQAVRLRRFGF